MSLTIEIPGGHTLELDFLHAAIAARILCTSIIGALDLLTDTRMLVATLKA